jgi:hypothetical protein
MFKSFLYNDVLVGVLPGEQRWGHGGEGGLAALHGHQPHRKNNFHREDNFFLTLIRLFTHVTYKNFFTISTFFLVTYFTMLIYFVVKLFRLFKIFCSLLFSTLAEFPI